MENQRREYTLDLGHFFDAEGEKLSLSYELDFSEYELFSTKPFISPVIVSGVIKNEAGVVTLNYDLNFTLSLNCDRCLDTFTREFFQKEEHALIRRLYSSEENDDFIILQDGKLHIDELVMDDILLEVPSKLLCSDDCKGLCSRCGVNLNHSDCQCCKKEIDPRLSVLSELLK